MVKYILKIVIYATKEIGGWEEREGRRWDREGGHTKSWYLSEGKKDKRSQQGTQEAKIISGKDKQMFSPSDEKLHSVVRVFRECWWVWNAMHKEQRSTG